MPAYNQSNFEEWLTYQALHYDGTQTLGPVELALLERNIAACKQYLQDPAELVKTLHNNMLKTFNEYEATHVTTLSPEERVCLLKLKGLHYLYTYPKTFADHETSRQNYLRLCGLLFEMYREVNDGEFRAHLAQIIESAQAVDDQDYTDSKGFTPSYWYGTVKEEKQGYFSLTVSQLPAVEQDIFEKELRQLTQNLLRKDKNNALQKHIYQAAVVIEEEIKRKEANKMYVNYHFYTQAISHLNALSTKPNDVIAAQHLNNLIQYAAGKPSFGKQMLGSLLVVCGVALALGALVSIILLPPLVAPITFFLLFIACITMYFLAGAMLGFGAIQIAENSHQGLSKALTNVYEVAKGVEKVDDAPEAPPAFAPAF